MCGGGGGGGGNADSYTIISCGYRVLIPGLGLPYL